MTKPTYAKNLQSAKASQLIHVDRAGRVRSPMRLRAIRAGYYALVATLFGIEGLLCWSLYQVNGALGLVMSGVVGVALVWVGWVITRGLKLRNGLTLLAADAPAAAREFASVMRAPLLPRRVRTLATQNLAAACAMQGRHAEAYEHLQIALRGHGKRQTIHARMARYAEVNLLTNLDRLDEARAKLAAIGAVPQGELLQVMHWTVELQLAFFSGRLETSEDELHKRASAALAITIAVPLIALLAWAFDRIGDEEMSQHLLREAIDRRGSVLSMQNMPRLRDWIDDQSPRLPQPR